MSGYVKDRYSRYDKRRGSSGSNVRVLACDKSKEGSSLSVGRDSRYS